MVLPCFQETAKANAWCLQPPAPLLAAYLQNFPVVQHIFCGYPAELCTKNISVFCREEGALHRANVMSQVPHQLLEQFWVLTRC